MRTASQHAFSLIILLLICIYTFKKMLKMFPQSIILNNVVSIMTQLKWCWDYLMQSFCQVPYKCDIVDVAGELPEHDATGGRLLGVRIFEGAAAEPIECAVCLCKIEEGEEIRDLRCNHIFHRTCLDRWLDTGYTICPLCRNHVTSAGQYLNYLCQEVIVLNFFVTHRDRHSWWLR